MSTEVLQQEIYYKAELVFNSINNIDNLLKVSSVLIPKINIVERDEKKVVIEITTFASLSYKRTKIQRSIYGELITNPNLNLSEVNLLEFKEEAEIYDLI